MTIEINYDGKKIDLFYFPYFPENKEDFSIIKVKSSGEMKTGFLKDENYFEDYTIAEEEAQIYLIKNAMDKRKAGYPDKIIGITQDIICNPGNGHFKLEIILTGIAIFKRKK